MAYLIGQSSVKDFERWTSAFQDNESFRAEHGELGYQIFQSLEDPDEIVVVFEWDDDEDPRAFFQSEEMRGRMTDAGLRSPPQLTLAKLVDHKSTQQPTA